MDIFQGGGGVDPNPKTFEALFCLRFDIMNIFFSGFFPAKQKVPRWCPRTQGGGQGDFDTVQIEAEFFPGLLPLGEYIFLLSFENFYSHINSKIEDNLISAS